MSYSDDDRWVRCNGSQWTKHFVYLWHAYKKKHNKYEKKTQRVSFIFDITRKQSLCVCRLLLLLLLPSAIAQCCGLNARRRRLLGATNLISNRTLCTSSVYVSNGLINNSVIKASLAEFPNLCLAQNTAHTSMDLVGFSGSIIEFICFYALLTQAFFSWIALTT